MRTRIHIQNKKNRKIMYLIGFFSLVMSLKIQAQCSGNEPVLFLGNDTVVCNNNSIVLEPVSGYDSYLWSNNSSSQLFTVTQEGTYSVEAIISSGNLVQNGDFESGNINFVSDYNESLSGPWGAVSFPGQYVITTSPDLAHESFGSCGDHTTGNGLMFIANGDDTPNTIVWQQSVTVLPNTNYNFSAWVTSVQNTSNPALLQFFVNNIQIGSEFSPSNLSCNWTQFTNTWNSGANTAALITIKNQNILDNGNDFALDDISFSSHCVNSDTIVIQFDSTSIDLGNTIEFCNNNIQMISCLTSDSTLQFMWSTGDTTLSIFPENTGVYSIECQTNLGCILTDSVSVTVFNTPTDADIPVIHQPCNNSDGEIMINNVIGGTSPFEYSLNSSSYTLNPVFSDLSEGEYTIQIEDANGCLFSTETIVLANTVPPMANFIIPSIIESDELINLYSQSSSDVVSYEWICSYGTPNQGFSETFLTSFENVNDGLYPITLIVSNQAGCKDSITKWIELSSNPLVFVPNTFTPDENKCNNSWQFVIDNIEDDSFLIKVYNRWGEIVWESKDPKSTWDGMFHNQLVQTGIYSWVIQLRGKNKTDQQFTGFLNVQY